MILIASTSASSSASSSRSNSNSNSNPSNSASTPAAGSFQFLVALFVAGTIGFAFLGLPKVSSLSLQSPTPSSQQRQQQRQQPLASNGKRRQHPLQNRRSWFLRSAAASTDTGTDAATNAASRALMESQAGGNSSNRRRRKDRIRNSDAAEGIISTTSGQNAGVGAGASAYDKEELPDPIVPFESVESVRLMDGDSVELVLREGEGGPTVIDPRDLHQTSDFELWMALRKHVVDVSASQVSVVLGTNYFTSRDKLLQDKIRARASGGSGSGSSGGNAIRLGNDTDEDTKPSGKSNSKACAWGIKMEPLAFAQYSDVVEATNLSDDEAAPQNRAEETGMYLMKHVDPATQKAYVFGASPDGLVTEHRLEAVADADAEKDSDESSPTPQASIGLLEIKSLWGRRHKSSLPVFDKCPSRFYDQIQAQMAICDKDWCDLMLFIPPGDGLSSGRTTKKRKGKSAKKRKKQAAAAADRKKTARKNKGRNYSIVRVKRNATYWNETVLPALIEFCDEVEAGTAEAKNTETEPLQEPEPEAVAE